MVAIGDLSEIHSTQSFISETDGSLAARAATDPFALTELYRRYLPGIDRYCRLRLRNPDLVEDVVSQVFLRVIEGLRRSRVESVRPWIFAIAHNEVVNAWRHRPTVGLDSLSERASQERSPEEQAIAAGDASEIWALISRLSAGEQRVVELRMVGLTNGEIGVILGKSYAWVGTNQYRALNRLRQMLIEQDGAGS